MACAAPFGRPAFTIFQFLPKSSVRRMRGGLLGATANAPGPRPPPTIAKARAASLAEASMAEIAVFCTSEGVTLFHSLPPSRESWIRPLLVPAQNVLASLGEKASAL